MRILILGCDKLSAYLAASLATEGHGVTVMDERSERLNDLPSEPQVDAVLTTGSLMDDLRSVGISHVGAFLALSDDDNKNVMAAQVVSHIFHVEKVICRIDDPHREGFYRGLGLNVVCATPALVDAIKNALKVTL